MFWWLFDVQIEGAGRVTDDGSMMLVEGLVVCFVRTASIEGWSNAFVTPLLF